jgi:serine/threonine-protein phosphatase 5
VKEFAPNHGRGGGLYFGSAVTERFLAKNNLQCLIRSHEVEDDGFAQYHGGKVVTVFSAPNYCGSVGNKAAIVRFGGEYEQLQGRVIQFVSAPPREARPSSPHD